MGIMGDLDLLQQQQAIVGRSLRKVQIDGQIVICKVIIVHLNREPLPKKELHIELNMDSIRTAV